MKPGQILQEKYQIESELSSKGGFGIVYVGKDLETGKTVAVKEIKAQQEKGSPDADATQNPAEETWEKKKEAFLEEARILRLLDDIPQVVRVYDSRDEGDTAYIVMEYLDGKTLKEARTQGKKFSAEEAYRIISELLSTLQKVHDRGIIHRDIAPDNIFLLSSGRIRLFDFGIAHTYGEGQEQKAWVDAKKKGYTPPEQIRKSKDQGPWTDVYAAAATYYELLTGSKPADADERRGKDPVIGLIRAGAQISPEEEAVIMEALAVDVKKRIPTAAAFLEKLRDARQNGRKKKRRKLLLAALAVLVFGAAGLTAAGLIRTGRQVSTPVVPETAENTEMLSQASEADRTDLPVEEKESAGEPTAQDGTVTVPDVAGADEAEAADILKQQSLTYSKVAETSSTVPKGKIIRQEPAAGSTVEKDAEVRIVVSLGSPEEETTAELVTLAPRTTAAPETAAPVRKNNRVIVKTG